MRGIVWAYNTDDAIAKLLEIEEDYGRLGIKPTNRVIGKSQTYIVFGNGDMWRVVLASDSAEDMQPMYLTLIYASHRKRLIRLSNLQRNPGLSKHSNFIILFHTGQERMKKLNQNSYIKLEVVYMKGG